MEKKYFIIFLLFLSYKFINAQITVFASDITSTSIYIEDDDLYFTDDYVFYKFDISDIDFPTTSFVFDVDGVDVDFVPYNFTKNGNDIYFGTIDHVGFGYMGAIFKLDTSTSIVTKLAGYPLHISANSLEYKLGFLYYGYYSDESPQNLRRLNLASTPPITPSTYVSKITTSLTINGFTMYLGTNDGKIYKKNMLSGTPEVLVYDDGVGRIIEMELFESQLYFIDADGIKRINPLDAVPVSQLLANKDDYGFFFSLAAKAYGDGDKYLFVTEIINNRILKIDLNDPILSTKKPIKGISMIFPNPALNAITVKTSLSVEEFSIYDLLGKRVFNISFSNQVFEHNLDISNLNSGVYHLQIKTINGIEIKKIIKQ